MNARELAEASVANIVKLGQGGAALFEQDPAEHGIRWWRATTYDLVRTGDGSAWLFLPSLAWNYPPIAAMVYRNIPHQMIEVIVAKGGGVMLGDTDLGRGLELRLVASRG